MPPVPQQGTNMLRQRCDAVVDIVGASHRDGQEFAKIARHRIGSNGFALDEAGVAVARLATRRLAVDQHDRPAAALQMQSRGDPDHSGAHNDNASHRRHPLCRHVRHQARLWTSCGSRALIVIATSAASAVMTSRKSNAASNEPVPVTRKPITAGATKPALWPPKFTMPTPVPI